MENHKNRTLICSVVFLDIVEYSRQPVAQQIRLKDCFNTVLSMALQGIAITDRIILDTGDGAAISLIGDPQDALLVATAFRDGVAAQAPGDAFLLRTRIGINLGPVRLVKDINGQPNIIGDGINVAQRVMTFAEPGQVLVSRSYHEVVSCLSDDYTRLFQYEGSRTDKHIREHEVYTVGATFPGLRSLAHARHSATPATGGAGALARNHAARLAMMIRTNVFRKPWLATSLTVVAILGAAITIRGYREFPAAGNAPAAAAGQPGVVTQPAEKKPAVVAGATAQGAPAATPPSAANREVAVVSLTITPWGEVYVDGKKQGVSPPLRDLKIAVGRHKIEVMNTSFPSHVETVNVRSGEKIRIKHKFQ